MLDAVFAPDGRFTTGVLRPKLPTLLVNMKLDALTNSLTGTILNGGDTLTLTLTRNQFTKLAPAPQRGNYTLVLPADPTQTAAATYPQGEGVATCVIDPLGAVKITGTLGDGTAFTTASTLDAYGTFDLYVAPYAAKGLFYGRMTLQPLAGSDLDGTLGWVKPANVAGTKIYKPGFTGTTTAIGASYTAPLANTMVIPLAPGAGNARLQLVPAGSTLIDRLLTLTTKNLLTDPTLPAAKAIKMTLTVANGNAAGTVPLTAPAPAQKIVAVIFKKTASVRGLVLGPVGTGPVLLSAP